MKRRDFLVGIPVTASVLAVGTIATAQGANPATLRVALLPGRERLDHHSERAAPEEASRGGAQEGHRAGRDDRLFLDDRGDALRPHRDRLLRPAVLRAGQVEGARHRAVRRRHNERGKPFYNSIIIANVDGPVKDVNGIKGQPFAFGDQASTSSHLAPRTFLAKKGLIGDKDYKVVHLGKHDAVARSVAAGQVPAGALSGGDLSACSYQGQESRPESKLKEIALSGKIQFRIIHNSYKAT